MAIARRASITGPNCTPILLSPSGPRRVGACKAHTLPFTLNGSAHPLCINIPAGGFCRWRREPPAGGFIAKMKPEGRGRACHAPHRPLSIGPARGASAGGGGGPRGEVLTPRWNRGVGFGLVPPPFPPFQTAHARGRG